MKDGDRVLNRNIGEITDTIPRQHAVSYGQMPVHSHLEFGISAISSLYEVAVLIPCYNESVTIANVVRDFSHVLPFARIYVYDNNSKDNTVLIATEAGAIVCHEPLQGKGNVVRRMFRDVEADLYILVDGDDTYDASKALEMIQIALTGPYDLVNCIRLSEKGELAYRRGHQFGNQILTGMVNFLFGNRVMDMLSGYKVLSRRFVKSFPLLSSGFEIETELTVHALELQMPTAHVKGVYRGRPSGSTSKLHTLRDGRRISMLILDLFKQERPLFFFTLIAIFFVLAAIGLSIPVLIQYVQTGLVPRFPTMITSIGILLLGAGSFACGLILDTVTRGRREAKMLHYLRIPAARTFHENQQKSQ